jgi:hypothetical protein
VLRWYLGFLNEKKKNKTQDVQLGGKSIEELGDKHPGMFIKVAYFNYYWSVLNRLCRLLLYNLSKMPRATRILWVTHGINPGKAPLR